MPPRKRKTDPAADPDAQAAAPDSPAGAPAGAAQAVKRVTHDPYRGTPRVRSQPGA